MKKVIVIGSGPSGIAAAAALMERGCEILMLDGGASEAAELVAETRAMHSATSEGDWIRLWQSRQRDYPQSKRNMLPRKAFRGSLFPYEDATSGSDVDLGNTSCDRSMAIGGFGNVWGAAILPFQSEQLLRWPKSAIPHADHYKGVLRYLPLAGVSDDLEKQFPLYVDAPKSLLSSPQAHAKLTSWRTRSDELARVGIKVGQSRLAVHALPRSEQSLKGCAYCGECLSGCRLDLIYRPQHTLQLWANHPHFKRKTLRVESVRGRPGQMQVFGYSESGEAKCFDADAVFLGAGAINTVKIALNSLGVEQVVLPIIDSNYCVLPLLSTDGPAYDELYGHHELCQIFMEVSANNDFRHGCHMQLYSYSTIYGRQLPLAQSIIAGFVRKLSRPLLRRLWVAQSYFHSDESIRGQMYCQRDQKGRLTIKMRAQTDEKVRQLEHKIVDLFAQHRKLLGFIPIRSQLRSGGFGRGYHFGGTFPMSESPREFETDQLGQLPGLPGVHIIDASVLPSIPQTTITLGVMANAYRIAQTVAGKGGT